MDPNAEKTETASSVEGLMKEKLSKNLQKITENQWSPGRTKNINPREKDSSHVFDKKNPTDFYVRWTFL